MQVGGTADSRLQTSHDLSIPWPWDGGRNAARRLPDLLANTFRARYVDSMPRRCRATVQSLPPSRLFRPIVRARPNLGCVRQSWLGARSEGSLHVRVRCPLARGCTLAKTALPSVRGCHFARTVTPDRNRRSLRGNSRIDKRRSTGDARALDEIATLLRRRRVPERAGLRAALLVAMRNNDV